MLKQNKFWAAIACLFMLFPAMVQAGDTDALRKKIMANQKKLVVMENITFSDDEGAFFWPIYETLQEELFQINQQTARIIVAYAAAYQNLSDDQAAKIMGDYYNTRRTRLDTLDRYMEKLFKGLPAKKVFRYFQVENKLDSIGRYELSKSIPLAR